ncbi:hypothetical protein [Burkholderia pseudomallei]|uniref:hypothetical protein n=1 Tax=Burkholderia pseudomallei TaxID=28450 RepID=UPI001FCC754B|nr:hypothetical protein [Burkholderia pseudomallei]
MNDQQQSRADALTDEHIATLKLAARAVTPQDIDGAERIESRPDGSYITCPACEGEGCIPFESDYCNYDHVAIGVQFYGVGTEPGAAEAYFRAAKPATILALLDRLERAESALAAPPVEQPAAAPADLQGLRRSILTSREIVRDQDGMLSHPAVPYLDEDVNYETFFAAFGIEATFIHMEDDVDCDTYDRYFASNSPDCCTWTPSSPQGDGWMLLEIYDTEDGPVALYVREKKPESMRERWKREKRESDAAAPSPADERAAFEAYVECRQCDECGHVGINDSHPTDAACGYSCGWTGPSPDEDKCPGCGQENVMSVACPKCSGRYSLLAEETVRAASANETGAEGTKTEAEIRKTMTLEQIRLERKLTCEAIDGAMAFGYQNTNPPPSADHWLAPYWKIGRKQYAAEFALRYLDDQLTEYLEGMPADETSRNLRDIARNALVDIEAATRSPAMAAEAVAFEITEQAAAEWASRHDVDHVLKHFSTQRNAIEDARTLHLLAAAPQPAQAGARVGLTDEQRIIDIAAKHGIGPTSGLGFARDLLQGADHA